MDEQSFFLSSRGRKSPTDLPNLHALLGLMDMAFDMLAALGFSNIKIAYKAVKRHASIKFTRSALWQTCHLSGIRSRSCVQVGDACFVHPQHNKWLRCLWALAPLLAMPTPALFARHLYLFSEAAQPGPRVQTARACVAGSADLYQLVCVYVREPVICASRRPHYVCLRVFGGANERMIIIVTMFRSSALDNAKTIIDSASEKRTVCCSLNPSSTHKLNGMLKAAMIWGVMPLSMRWS